MTDFGVHKAYTARVHSVCTILTVVLGVSGAQAGAWEEFERRCLVPMENLETIDLSAFEASDGKGSENGNAAFSLFFETGHLIVEVSDDDHPVVCVLNVAPDADAQTVAAATLWLDASATRYETWPSELIPGGRAVMSTSREPRMLIEFGFQSDMPETEFSTIIALETDLES